MSILTLFVTSLNAAENTDAPLSDEPDACSQQPENEQAPEKIRARVHSTSCYTARWIDSLFGEQHEFDESEVAGLVTTGLKWSEFDGVDHELRLRLRTELPNMSSRVKAFLGRVEEDAYIRETRPNDDAAVRQSISDDQDSWLLGFGYRGNPERLQGFDYSIGIRLNSSPDPYVKARYRFIRAFDRNDLRFHQTLFWRLDEGFGTTSSLDLAWDLGDKDLIRWETIGTVSEDIDGLNWWTGATHYRHLGGRRALASLFFIRGETDEPVELQEFGFQFTMRQPLSRDWLFLEYGPSLTWPRELKQESRKASLGFRVAVEMAFGNYSR